MERAENEAGVAAVGSALTDCWREKDRGKRETAARGVRTPTADLQRCPAPVGVSARCSHLRVVRLECEFDRGRDLLLPRLELVALEAQTLLQVEAHVARRHLTQLESARRERTRGGHTSVSSTLARHLAGGWLVGCVACSCGLARTLFWCCCRMPRISRIIVSAFRSDMANEARAGGRVGSGECGSRRWFARVAGPRARARLGCRQEALVRREEKRRKQENQRDR